jgi:hypothetical protein
VSDGKVIHVRFGPGGGLVRRDAKPENRAGSAEPLTRLFTRAEAATMARLSTARLSSLSRALVVCPTGRRGRQDAYTFTDLAQLRVVRALLDAGAAMGVIVATVRAVRQALPAVTEPLLALRFVLDGKRLVVHGPGGAFEPLSGQRRLDLEPPRGGAVVMLRPSTGRDQVRLAYELYLRGSALDEQPETMDAAERLYERAIELDPRLAIAYTNLGNIRYRRHDPEAAQALYEQAIALDGRQPEALYNFGYLLLERGDASTAIPLLLAAIASDPKFADACFNLATALEQAGRDDEAQGYWRRYLGLEPTGTWADIARRHLR